MAIGGAIALAFSLLMLVRFDDIRRLE
jgi:hypothetical protein